MGDVRISARSTLGALNKWIETISGNLVGSQITGYKATRVNFADSLVDLVRGGSGRAGGLGGLNPIQIGNGGISVGSTTTDFRQGSLTQTGNNTDLAIQGNSFFTVADSSGKIVYTRDGTFNFDDQGFLVTKEGQTVLSVFDSTRAIADNLRTTLTDLGGTGGVSVVGDTATSFGGGADTATTLGANKALLTYFENPNTPGQDRVIAENFIGAGQLGTTAGQAAGPVTAFTIGTTAIQVALTASENTANRTSADNARLLARAVNAQSDITGVGASVVVNQNDQTQATIVFSAANRTVSEASTRLPTTTAGGPAFEQQVLASDTGVTKVYRDNKGNTFYAINSGLISTAAPAYQPAFGDVMAFDSTGALINTSRGKDATSAPPVNTGVHVALSRFTNDQGLQKRRGSSQFLYSEASGSISVGYAGQTKLSQINTKEGLEQGGVSTIGLENTIISQATEASNSSVTDALPELTVAQKTFTSNTKVINVGNTIVDDLNGLIR